jgi:hypothetical protein
VKKLLVAIIMSSFVLVCAVQAQIRPPAQTSPLTSHPVSAPASYTVTRDAQALVFLQSALTAVGGSVAVASIQDVTATGSVTHYWSSSPQSGTVTIKIRGIGQIRQDEQLTSGTQAWAVSNGLGSFKHANGKITPIPFHDAINLGALTTPILRLAAAVADTNTDIIDKGVVTVQTQQFRQIRIHKNAVASTTDADGSANRIQTADYFFDPNTYQLVGVQDQTHPVKSMTRNIAHAVYFSDYRSINGVSLPFSVTEYIGGQKTWSIQLSAFSFNTGLTDADFQIQ